MNIKYKQIEIILLFVFTAVVLNVLNDIHILSYEGVYTLYNQQLFLGIGYVCISKLLDIKKRYSISMMLGQLFLFLACASLYYSKTVADFIAFVVSVYTIINTIVLEQNMYQEDRKDHVE